MTLEEIKQKIAEEKGYTSWEDLYKSMPISDYVENLKKAYELNVKIKEYNVPRGYELPPLNELREVNTGEKKSEKKYWFLAFMMILFLTVILSFYFIHQLDEYKQENIKLKLELTNSKIDSVNSAKTETINKAVQKSKTNANKANVITKKIINEKAPIIRDTTLAAKQEYITNYKYQPYP